MKGKEKIYNTMRYQITGEPMPVVICDLEANESIKNESGAMVWMTPNMQMETNSGGGAGKIFGRIFTGESLMQNVYTARNGPGMIAFSSSFPGSIMAVEVGPGKSVVCQKTAFLASEMSVEMSVFFQKKGMTGFFGGEGFIMQKFSGRGLVFLEIDGSAVEYQLAPGQQLIVDTGNLAMCDDTVSIDVQTVRGVKNVLFGGEGLFHTVVTGPGRVILQTMPISGFAQALLPYIPTKSSSD